MFSKKKYLFKLILSVIFCLFVGYDVTGQNKPIHNKKIYQIDGKTYWNKDLPVFIRLSTTDTDDNSVLIKSENKYADPYYLDSEGPNYIRTKWAFDKQADKLVYPLQEVLWEVIADGLAPKTKFTFFGENVIKDKVYNINNKTKLYLESKDMTSGVNATYYSINGYYYRYDSVISFSTLKDGVYDMSFYGVDNVGNEEDEIKITIKIKSSIPETLFIIDGDEYNKIFSSRTKVELLKMDVYDDTKTWFKINNGNYTEYKSMLNFAQLTEGQYTITYYSEDVLKNKEEEKTYSFFLDKTPPTVLMDILGDFYEINGKKFSSGSARVQLTSFDNKSGVKEIFYSVNNSDFELYTSPFFLNNQSGGDLKIQYYAVDNVNNKTYRTTSSESQFTMSYLDLNGPSLSYSYTGPNITIRDTVYISPKTDIKLAAVDKESGVKNINYNIKNTLFVGYDKPFRIETKGYYDIQIEGFDNVNNRNIKTFYFLLDSEGPVIKHVFDTDSIGQATLNDEEDALKIYPDFVKLFLSATDEYVGIKDIYYTYNNQTLKYDKSISGFKKGMNELKIVSTDNLGNISEKVIKFIIK
jgi:hypothetical protein